MRPLARGRGVVLFGAPALLGVALGSSCSALIGADFGDYAPGEGGGPPAGAGTSATSGSTSGSSTSASGSGGGGGAGGASASSSSSGSTGGSGGAPSCGAPPANPEATTSFELKSNNKVVFGDLVRTGDPERPLDLVGSFQGNVYTARDTLDDRKESSIFRLGLTADLEMSSFSVLGYSIGGEAEVHGAARFGDLLVAGGAFSGAFVMDGRGGPGVVSDGDRRGLVLRADDGTPVGFLPQDIDAGSEVSLVLDVADARVLENHVVVGATGEAEAALGLDVDPAATALFVSALDPGGNPAASLLLSPPGDPGVLCAEDAPSAFANRANTLSVAVVDERIFVAGTTCGTHIDPPIEPAQHESFITAIGFVGSELVTSPGLHLGDRGGSFHNIRAIAGGDGPLLVAGNFDADLDEPHLELGPSSPGVFVVEADFSRPDEPRWGASRVLDELDMSDVGDLVRADGRTFIAGRRKGDRGADISTFAELDAELEVVWSLEVASFRVRKIQFAGCALHGVSDETSDEPGSIRVIRIPLEP